ncbi:MAG: hypothetical protein FWG05_03760 [Kiritimatiellaeota bacterium]|nr:hypothetical protein [Kiritimatiellota bacterium]
MKEMKKVKKIVISSVVALACAGAQASTWTNLTSGTYRWDNAANWDAGVPSGNGSVADFNVPLEGDITVELPASDLRLGKLILGASNGGGKVTLTGGGQIVLNNNSENVLIVHHGSGLGDEIAVPLYFDRDTTVSNLSSSALLINAKIGCINRETCFTLECGTLVLRGAAKNDEFKMVVNDGLLICDKPYNTVTLYNVELNGGVIRMNNTNLLETSSNYYFFNINGGIFDMNGHSQFMRQLGGDGGVITSLAPGGGTVALEFQAHAPASYGGIIADGPTQVVRMTGYQNVLTLSGENTFSGGVNFSGKDFRFGHPQALGTEREILLSNAGNTLRSKDENDIRTEYDVNMKNTTAYGAIGGGGIYFKRLYYNGGSETYGIVTHSKTTFESMGVVPNVAKGGAHALVITGDIDNIHPNKDARWINIQEGMIALEGELVSHLRFVLGPQRQADYNISYRVAHSSTLGMSGVKNFTLGNQPGQIAYAMYGGGFSGYGGDLDVTFNGGAALVWGGVPHYTGTPFFIGSTAPDYANVPGVLPALIFGHEIADGTATLHNDIVLSTITNSVINVFRGTAPIDGRFAGNLTCESPAILSKRHNGVLSLAGANNAWPGMTEVIGGVLRVDGGLANDEVFVDEDGALGGFGTITAADVIVDGALLAESGTGKGLTINGDVELNGALRVLFGDDNAGIRTTVVNGTVDIGLEARLEIVEPEGGFTPDLRRWKIIRGGVVNGCFDGLPEDGVIELADGTVWTVNYINGDISIGPNCKGTLLIIK